MIHKSDHPVPPMLHVLESRSRKRQKRRNVIIDTVDGKPAVQLTGHSMRALVEDPSPLMIEGGLGRRPLKRQKVSIVRSSATFLDKAGKFINLVPWSFIRRR